MGSIILRVPVPNNHILSQVLTCITTIRNLRTLLLGPLDPYRVFGFRVLRCSHRLGENDNHSRSLSRCKGAGSPLQSRSSRMQNIPNNPILTVKAAVAHEASCRAYGLGLDSSAQVAVGALFQLQANPMIQCAQVTEVIGDLRRRHKKVGGLTDQCSSHASRLCLRAWSVQLGSMLDGRKLGVVPH